MSLYADYLRERTDDRIIEDVSGFVTYRYLDAETVYIIDIFVIPEVRKRGLAGALADLVIEEARAKGCKKAVGSVVPSTRGATENLQRLIQYGMKLESAAQNMIVVAKEI